MSLTQLKFFIRTSTTMAKLHSFTGIELESVFVPPSFKPPSATKTLYLAGAGVRHLEMQGTIQKVVVAGLYLEEKAIESLAIKWKGKTNVELLESDEFYNEIYNGPFEKFIHATLLVPVTGKFFSDLAAEKIVGMWKEEGTYNDADAETIAKYLEAFKDENIKPGEAVLYTILPDGTATVTIARDGIIPEAPIGVIENKKWGPTQLVAMIGKNGIFQEARLSVASRLPELFN